MVHKALANHASVASEMLKLKSKRATLEATHTKALVAARQEAYVRTRMLLDKARVKLAKGLTEAHSHVRELVTESE